VRSLDTFSSFKLQNNVTRQKSDSNFSTYVLSRHKFSGLFAVAESQALKKLIEQLHEQKNSPNVGSALSIIQANSELVLTRDVESISFVGLRIRH